MKKITIIGCGNLGSSIVDGLISSNFCNANDLTLTKRDLSTLKTYEANGVNVTSNNQDACKNADVIILAIKPFQVLDILRSVRDECSGKVIISVVTGVLINDIKKELTQDVFLFRAMPNTAIAIRESLTCLSADNVNDPNIRYVTEMFACLGKVVNIDEKLMDAATVLGACGIAYAMRYIRANIQGGIEIGFDAKTAGLIAAQTVKGASELLLRLGTHPEQEIDKVTTPKGCTIAGLNEMEHQGFSSSLIKGISASYKKINN